MSLELHLQVQRKISFRNMIKAKQHNFTLGERKKKKEKKKEKRQDYWLQWRQRKGREKDNTTDPVAAPLCLYHTAPEYPSLDLLPWVCCDGFVVGCSGLVYYENAWLHWLVLSLFCTESHSILSNILKKSKLNFYTAGHDWCIFHSFAA